METLSGLMNHMEAELTAAIRGTECKLGDGGCGDYADYKFNVGQIRGYRQALRIIVDARSKYLNEDEGQ